MTRLLATTGLLAALAFPAFADEAFDKRVEAAIVDTIKLTSAGQLDTWIDKWCDPNRCHDTAAKNDMKNYQLKSAQNFSKACLQEGDTVSVKQKKGDVMNDKDGALWYLNCKGRMLGVPVRVRYDKEKDKLWFTQLSF